MNGTVNTAFSRVAWPEFAGATGRPCWLRLSTPRRQRQPDQPLLGSGMQLICYCASH